MDVQTGSSSPKRCDSCDSPCKRRRTTRPVCLQWSLIFLRVRDLVNLATTDREAHRILFDDKPAPDVRACWKEERCFPWISDPE